MHSTLSLVVLHPLHHECALATGIGGLGLGCLGVCPLWLGHAIRLSSLQLGYSLHLECARHDLSLKNDHPTDLLVGLRVAVILLFAKTKWGVVRRIIPERPLYEL